MRLVKYLNERFLVFQNYLWNRNLANIFQIFLQRNGWTIRLTGMIFILILVWMQANPMRSIAESQVKKNPESNKKSDHSKNEKMPAKSGTIPFLAGEDSFGYQLGVNQAERRGPEVKETPQQIKAKIKPILNELRQQPKGLMAETERNIESYFIVADAFEADGRLSTTRDILHDLQEHLESLLLARSGKKDPHQLIQEEKDLLAFRDAHNIHVIQEHYLSGAQPSAKGYRWLKSKGVTTIINLREPSEHEEKIVKELGLRYVHISWPDLQSPSLEQVRQIVEVVEQTQKQGGKVFQHCLRGIGRDGTMVCCVRIASGISADKAIEEWLKASPTWLEDQAKDKSGQPVQIKTVKEFEKSIKKR